MVELKTKLTKASVDGFLKRVDDEGRRKDCQALVRLMKRAVKAKPRMWGSSIVGFGDFSYKNASGRENDWFLAGFSPRKADLTLYIYAGFDRYESLMAKLGKHKKSGSCLHIKRLADVDLTVLEALVSASVKHMKQTRGSSSAT
jgi:Domain of unknown function (DU1801)